MNIFQISIVILLIGIVIGLLVVIRNAVLLKRRLATIERFVVRNSKKLTAKASRRISTRPKKKLPKVTK